MFAIFMGCDFSFSFPYNLWGSDVAADIGSVSVSDRLVVGCGVGRRRRKKENDEQNVIDY